MSQDIGEDSSSIAAPCSKEKRVQRDLSCIVMLGVNCQGLENRKNVDASKMSSSQRLKLRLFSMLVALFLMQ